MNKSKWILLAEDNAIDAELALRALEANEVDNKVVRVPDGAEALDCLCQHGPYETRVSGPPLLVLLDLKMPKVDGLEVLRRIKTDPRLKPIPVVIFTSSREESDLERCYQLGANAYVVKPVDFSEYRAVLQHIRTFWTDINELPPDGRATAGPKAPQLVTAA
jgi:CheY-like chemotaxis protein